MELIPGLPNDLARDCLVRVSYKQFSTVLSVCKAWKSEVELPEFRRYRKETSNCQKMIVMAQARVCNQDLSSAVMKRRVNPVYGFTVLEQETGVWSELPPPPGFSDGLPMFCQVVGVGSDLVVLGGLNSETWEVCNSVFMYDFTSATWRRGADMAGQRRSFFGCASDGHGTVYVAGGHDDEKNALRSAMAYDVARDEWTPLPDMARERDECKAVFHSGKLHVIGGYCTERQGRFERNAEVFDFATWQWNQITEENFLASASCPRTCVRDDDGKFYMCHGGDIVARRDATWQSIAKLPAEVCNVMFVTTWHGKLLVIGSPRYGEPHMAYVLDLKSYKWTRVESPVEYAGHVQSGCYFEI